MFPLIPAWVMVIVIAVAMYAQWAQKRYEHAFTRFFLFGLYLILFLFPNMDIEVARFYSRYFVALVMFVEVLSFYFRRGLQQK